MGIERNPSDASLISKRLAGSKEWKCKYDMRVECGDETRDNRYTSWLWSIFVGM